MTQALLLEYPESLDYRRLGSLFRRLAHSEFAAAQLRLHLSHMRDRQPNLEDGTICVFGSVARGEMDLDHSDIDLLFIGHQPQQRNAVLRELARSHRGLDFHGAEALLRRPRARHSREKLALRFPAVTADDLLAGGTEASTRRMQFLLEASPLLGETTFHSLTRSALDHYSLLPRSKRRDRIATFTREVDAFFESIRIHAGQAGKTSLFYAKFFLLRQVNFMLVRLSFLAAIYMKRQVLDSPHPARSFASFLRASQLEKILYWGSNDVWSSRTFRLLQTQAPGKLQRRIAAANNLNPEDVPESPIHYFTTLAHRAAKNYADALDVINAPAIREHLEDLAPVPTAWEHDEDIQMMRSHTELVRSRLADLARALRAAFETAGDEEIFNRPFRGSGLEAATLWACGSASDASNE